MFAAIMALVQGIVSGIAGPLASAYEKSQDVTLEGFKAGTVADQEAYKAWVDYQVQIQSLKLQANSWWGPRVLYMLVGGAAALHFCAVVIDSVPLGHLHAVGAWAVPKLPPPYDTYEGWVVASLFVVSLTAGPASAVTAWLHRK